MQENQCPSVLQPQTMVMNFSSMKTMLITLQWELQVSCQNTQTRQHLSFWTCSYTSKKSLRFQLSVLTTEPLKPSCSANRLTVVCTSTGAASILLPLFPISICNGLTLSKELVSLVSNSKASDLPHLLRIPKQTDTKITNGTSTSHGTINLKGRESG